MTAVRGSTKPSTPRRAGDELAQVLLVRGVGRAHASSGAGAPDGRRPRRRGSGRSDPWPPVCAPAAEPACTPDPVCRRPGGSGCSWPDIALRGSRAESARMAAVADGRVRRARSSGRDPAATPARCGPPSSGSRVGAGREGQARRHLPARRLHPDQGAAARRRGRRPDPRVRAVRRHAPRSRASTWPASTPTRTASSPGCSRASPA